MFFLNAIMFTCFIGFYLYRFRENPSNIYLRNIQPRHRRFSTSGSPHNVMPNVSCLYSYYIILLLFKTNHKLH